MTKEIAEAIVHTTVSGATWVSSCISGLALAYGKLSVFLVFLVLMVLFLSADHFLFRLKRNRNCMKIEALILGKEGSRERSDCTG